MQNVAAGAPRIPGIDGLRAAAILIVMAAHGGLWFLVPGGFGVTVFFFLSGYLITTLLRLELDRAGRIDLAAFYARRAWRILPPLYITMMFTAGMMLIGLLDGRLTISGLATDALFLTNYAEVLGTSTVMPIPLWSLDVEEHFYLLFPALLLFLRRKDPTGIAKLLLALCVGVLVVRCVSVANGFAYYVNAWTHTRIDSIVFGCVLALWHNPVLDERPWRPNVGHLAGALGVILLTFFVRDEIFRQTVRYTLQAVALFVIFSYCIQAEGTLARVLGSRPLKVVALLSYTLYLVHMPLLHLFGNLPQPLSVAAAYGAAFAYSAILYVAVERPIARWRRRSLVRALNRRERQDGPGRLIADA